MTDTLERTDTIDQLTLPPLANRSPRLTKLEVIGFKSFANRTVISFEEGITAVVGPNGSGKSNVADAVRWVLGEQGASAIRAKKTEDVIFGGGVGKSQAGMAEATLTFDNSDGWLPIEFAEVTVTRKAYRGAENQYLINGRKVRLKDVQQLTASLGHSHVVIGQGLVESALSQKPNERRALFEHAADLSGLRMKVADTERNLAETDANATRVRDILEEVEPRLKHMEKAARQAAEWHEIRGELLDLERGHFGGLLQRAAAQLATATTREADAKAQAEAAQAAVDAELVAGEDARNAAQAARGVIAAHDAASTELDDRVRRLRHERDLANERLVSIDRRLQDMNDTRGAMEEQAAEVAGEIEKLAGEIAALNLELESARAGAMDLAAAAETARGERGRLETLAESLAAQIVDGERDRAALAQQIALLEQKRDALTTDRERVIAAGNERGHRISALEMEIRAAIDAATSETEKLVAIEQVLVSLERADRDAAQELDGAKQHAAELERAHGEATTRLTILRRMQEQGEGLFAGVRETLRAAKSGELAGVVGTVAEVIASPAELETAIEVALGSHLQDIVVERWNDAERAIAHLKRAGTGRATFQPLETVRTSRRPGDEQQFGRIAGARGIAADLVRGDERVRPVIDALLGRTLVVSDLDAARAALPTLPLGWSAVTLNGEIARSGGSVTGGAAVRESGVLGRERELRDLPGEIARLAGVVETARVALAETEERIRGLAGERRSTESTRAALIAAAEERARQRTRLDSWLAELLRERDGSEARIASLDEEALRIADQHRLTMQEQADLETAVAQAIADRDGHASRVALAAEALAEAEREAAQAAQLLSVLEERLRAEQRREQTLQGQARGVAYELSLRQERIDTLRNERTELEGSISAASVDILTLEQERSSRDIDRVPLEQAVRDAEAQASGTGKLLDAARNALLDAERAHGHAQVQLERFVGDLESLQRRAADDLGFESIEEIAPLFHDAGALDASEASVVQEREREIHRLKDRLRRIGYVGEDAVADYEREAERAIFLRTQLDDIDGTSAALRQLLDDLDHTMKQRFEETFARVATAFTDLFTILFGGGTAELIMVRDEDGEPGIDVVAQPPGKRLQNLALLSGGERSLTAVALLFAILRVNPTPFCLMDEVDAALDEANVLRFREQLKALANQTQMIMITHNRGTIEIADTLYGVSMGSDGVSKVLSLRLSDIPTD